MLGSSFDEDWSTREEPITEVVLIYKQGKVIAAYTPKVFEANYKHLFESIPSLETQRIQLNTMKLKDLVLK